MNIRYKTDYSVFEWDSEKCKSNIYKHGIDFKDAVAAFEDSQALCAYDIDSSVEEDRYILTGRIGNRIIAVVIYTDRRDRIRIISARLATKRERNIYEEHAKWY